MEITRKDNTIISCSSNHAIAIGIHGHVYAWGSSLSTYNEKSPNKSDSSSTSSIQHEYFTEKMGFADASLSSIPKPAFYNLHHPIYNIKAYQVSCSQNFSAIVACENSNSKQINDHEKNFIFEKETEDFLPENPLPSFQIPIEIYAKILVTNKIRKEVEEYLKVNSLSFIDLFKSNRIKSDSFINILKNIVRTTATEEELIEFISYKQMKLAGNTIKLRPLYELVYKCDQSKGVLYLMGLKNEILPFYGDQKQYYSIKHDTLNYHLIKFPDSVSVAKVACGKHFVLVLSHSSRVFSWGSKNSPALGKNRSATYLQIKPLSDLSIESLKIVDISCGNNHCLALSNNGVIYSWGKGALGKIGNGRQDNIFRPEPINVNNSDVVYIKAGHNSSFCKTQEGLCYAWGDISNNRFGAISYGNTDKPMNFIYDFDIADIAIGSTHCVYVSQVGTLYASKPDEDSLIFLNHKHKNLEGIEFYQVSGQGSNFFAVNTRGSIFSWSYSQASSVLGRPGDHLTPTEIFSCSQHFALKETEEMNQDNKEVDLETSKQIVMVACTEENTFLITDKGEGIGCGSNELGQLCLIPADIDEYVEDQDDINHFVMIPRLSRVYKVNIIAISCGTGHILAINNENVALSWGANMNGQLGKGTFSKSDKYPEIIKSLKGFEIKSVAAGDSHSLVLTMSGEVFAFGSAEHGKLGLGKLSSSIRYNTPEKIKTLKNIKKISCGENHSAAINSEKVILTWGYGWQGQLGYGLKETLNEPTSILIQVNWKDIACGAAHTVGLSVEGIVYHWGEINTPEEDDEVLAPIKVKGLEDIKIKFIFASFRYSAGVIELNNTVYMWGRQYYKRLISDKTEVQDGEISKPLGLTVPFNERIKDLSINKYHGCLVTDQGKVYTWGYANNGRLGNPSQVQSDCTVPYNYKNINLSKVLIQDGDKNETFKEDLQKLLQDESEMSNQSNLREIDQQIMSKFIKCIEMFVEISNQDSGQSSFFLKCEHKQLTRLQQEPYNCKLIQTEPWNTDVNEKLQAWGALITIFQVHSCYMDKLLSLNIKDDKKLDMLNFLYCDVESDSRMLYMGVYLSRLLLKRVLLKKDISFPEFIDSNEACVYRELVFKIILGSNEDMSIFRKLAADIIQQLGLLVHGDEFGIDQDPTHGISKAANIKITAYQSNKNTIDRRMNKLKQLMGSFIDLLKKFSSSNSFSSVIFFIANDFLVLTSEFSNISHDNFKNLNENTMKIIHTVLKLIFEPLVRALESPDKYYILTEISFQNPENNFKSLSETVRKFFDGTELGLQGERWLIDVNNFLKSERCQEVKRMLLEGILNIGGDLEEKYLQALFLHSLEPFNKEITVNGSNLVLLHRFTERHIEKLRVNNPSYDPLTIILKELGPAPTNRLFNRGDFVNLTLLTRCLRQDQSIVRCPECDMLIPRDMAPSNFKQVIDIYDPMPPNSSESILSNILATGPRKQHKAKILHYINAYLENFISFLKDFSMFDKVRTLFLNIDTVISAELGINIEGSENFEAFELEKDRERILLQIEERCGVEYKRRIHHSLLQIKISKSLDGLYDLMVSRMNDCLIDPNEQQVLLFNLEYGASNLELEQFSDSVMFSIYLNKIREYTSKKEMSLSLFESLTKDMKDGLRGFMKRSLNDLIKKKFITEFSLDAPFLPRNIVFSFEIDNSYLIIIATHSPKKINICGRDEYREEELLFYEKLSEEQITSMREYCKTCSENELK